MAFLQTQFFSKALNLCVSVNVLMPVSATPAAERCVPVLYLLHGYSDDHSMWLRRTSIERYAETIAPEFAIVMPAVDHSFYTDERHGNKYWTFVSQELPEVMSSLFPISSRREDTFVAGLSMGGYGALKLALNQPDRFLAAASFSGACDMSWQLNLPGDSEQLNHELFDIFGSLKEFTGSMNDNAHMAKDVARRAVKPHLYLACGTEDFLYDNNLSFHKHLDELGYAHKWEATPDHAHTWIYWDMKVQVALEWFVELRNKEGGGKREETRASAQF